jgi:cysteine-rich repeat protein
MDFGYEPKPDWTEDMPKYETEGQRVMSVGRVRIEYAEFHDAGKQWMYQCGMNTCAQQYAALNGFNVMANRQGSPASHQYGTSRNGGLLEAPIYRHAKTRIILKGISSLSPRTGFIVTGFPAMTLEENILVGHELTVRNTDATIVNNLFYGSDRQTCGLTCPESMPVTLFNGGSLTFKDNRVMEAYVGWDILFKCGHLKVPWTNNVALGNWMGAHIHPTSCPNLPLQVYRNAVGVGAQKGTSYVSNVTAVENGIGLANHDYIMPPEEFPALSYRWFRGRTKWMDSTVIGRSQKTRLKREAAAGKPIADWTATDRAQHCQENWEGGPYTSGGLLSGFRQFGAQWNYVGLQITTDGSFTAANAPANSWHEIENVHFVGFPGTDECGRANVAMSNDPAGIGKGKFNHYWDIFTAGRVQTDTVTGNYGGMVCHPTFVRRLNFTETPLQARWQFSMGARAKHRKWGENNFYQGRSSLSQSVSAHQEHVPAYSAEVYKDSCAGGGYERERNGRTESTCSGIDGWPKAAKQHDDSTDYGFSECQLFDEDGSLKAAPADWPRTVQSSPPDSPLMYMSAAPRQWPSMFNGHCQYTIENVDWWDTKDDINAINRCPPFMRREISLLMAAKVPARQGVSFQKPSDGSDVADWGKHGSMPLACTPIPSIGGMDCNTEFANDYVYVKNVLPKKVVSGSEVLYGPVAISTCSYDGGQPIVNMVPTEYFPHVIPTGTSPAGGGRFDMQHEDFYVVQPLVHMVTNGGCYRIDYTGDSGVFKTNTFSLLNTEMMPNGKKHVPRAPRNDENSWVVVFESWFTFPGKINVFFNEKYIPPVGRRNRVTSASPAGTNYFNPGSRVLSWVVKGTKARDRVKLKLIDVVEVNLIVAETFDSFFNDNDIDPNTISPSFAASVPPDYAANYDPDKGNIVKQNRFVRNMASVLRINPGRIRVTNIVPGNRRRLRDGTIASGLDIQFDISAVDPCISVNCGTHGTCNDQGRCDCQSNWVGLLCDSNPCANVTCGQHGSCTSSLGAVCQCTAGWSGSGCEIAPSPNDPCTSVVCPAPQACHAPSSCVPRTCTPSSDVVCGAPANGAAVCPNSTDKCVFYPGGTCSLANATNAHSETTCLNNGGTWTPSTQGHCAIPSPDVCAAALIASATGVACGNARCIYQAGGMCSSSLPLANGTVCDDGNATTSQDSCHRGFCVGIAPPPGTPQGSQVASVGNSKTFAELNNVADALISKASAGTLDIGSPITGLKVSKPPDVCGVPGGNGTTCLDACAIPNGDNSSCADACGIPNGNGFSCRDKCDQCTAMNPNMGSDVALCSAVNVSGSNAVADQAACATAGGGSRCQYTAGTINGDGSACAPPVVFSLDQCSTTERQRVQLRGPTGMVGQLVVSFNGEITTQALSIPYMTIDDMRTAVASLATVGAVSIVGLLNNGAIAEGTGGSTRVDFAVEFTATASNSPANFGKLPLIQLESVPAQTTAGTAIVTRVCSAAVTQTYEEQLVQASGPSNGSFTLTLSPAVPNATQVETSAPIPLSATPAMLQQTLTQMTALSGYNAFEVFSTHGRDDVAVSTSSSLRAWTIRFYPTQGAQMLLFSHLGLPGNLALFSFASTSLTGNISTVYNGSVPAGWLPTTCVDGVRNGDELGTDCGGSCSACPLPPPPPPPPCASGCCLAKDPTTITCAAPSPGSACPDSTNCVHNSVEGSCGLSTQSQCTAALSQDSNGTACLALKCLYVPPVAPSSGSFIVVAAPIRVCQDGKRASNEECDDGNAVNGDGCSTSCTIEDGFVCPTNFIGALSQCEKPQLALVTFDAGSRTVLVDEGNSAILTVVRSGEPRSCSAKLSNVSCGQPSLGACPDNTQDCVLTGSICALSNQSACTAALAQDSTGAACMAVKCKYTHGTLGSGSVQYRSIDNTAIETSGDYSGVSGVLHFADNVRSVSVTVNTSVDNMLDEFNETFAIVLSSATNGLLGAERSIKAIVSIVNHQVCQGWPPALPINARDPCTSTELASPLQNQCNARGSCPWSGAPLQPHKANCSFVCKPGYFVVGTQPTCGVTGNMYSNVTCELGKCSPGAVLDQSALLDPNTTAANCTKCPAGKYSPNYKTPCVSCSAGSLTNTLTSAGASTCTLCPAGRFSVNSTDTCQRCGNGFVTDTTTSPGASLCTACPAGKADEDLSSATNCTQCIDGYMSQPGQTLCVPILTPIVPGINDSTSVPVVNDSTPMPVVNDSTPMPVVNDSTSVPVTNDSMPVPVTNNSMPVPVINDSTSATTTSATTKVSASASVAGAVAATVFLSSLADSMEGVDVADIGITSFLMTLSTSASIPCSAPADAMERDFKAGVERATGATDGVTIGGISGCSRRRILQSLPSPTATITYTIRSTNATAAIELAEALGNTTTFALTLVSSINSAGGLGGVVLNVSDVATFKPAIATSISYEVLVQSGVNASAVSAVARDPTSMLAIIQQAAAAVGIMQTISSVTVQVDTTPTPSPPLPPVPPVPPAPPYNNPKPPPPPSPPPTIEPSVTDPTAQVVKVVTLKLGVDIRIIGAAGSASRTRFQTDFTRDVATLLGVSVERITIDSIAAGSVVVVFSVWPGANGSPILTATITNTFSSSAVVVAGTYTISPASVTWHIVTKTPPVTATVPDDDSDSVVVAVVVPIVVVIVLLGLALLVFPGSFCDKARNSIGIERCKIRCASVDSSGSTKLSGGKYDVEPKTLLKTSTRAGVTAPSADMYVYEDIDDDTTTISAIEDVETSLSPKSTTSTERDREEPVLPRRETSLSPKSTTSTERDREVPVLPRRQPRQSGGDATVIVQPS